MSSWSKTIRYAGLSFGEIFRLPSVLSAFLVFLLLSLLAGGTVMLLGAGVLVLLGWSFFGSFLIGFLLSFMLVFLLFFASVLQARVIEIYGTANSMLPPDVFHRGLILGELTTYFLSFPWITQLKGSRYLLLPVLVLRTGDLAQAQRALANQAAAEPTRADPQKLQIRLMSSLMVLLAIVLGVLAGWLAASNLNIEAFLSLPKQIFILEIGVLAFLLILLPALGAAALLRGFYHADLYQQEFISDLPEQNSLLTQILNTEASL